MKSNCVLMYLIRLHNYIPVDVPSVCVLSSKSLTDLYKSTKNKDYIVKQK